MNTLAERLKYCMEKLGLAQGELAKKAGVKNQSIIGSLESGYRKKSSYIPSFINSETRASIELAELKTAA